MTTVDDTNAHISTTKPKKTGTGWSQMAPLAPLGPAWRVEKVAEIPKPSDSKNLASATCRSHLGTPHIPTPFLA